MDGFNLTGIKGTLLINAYKFYMFILKKLSNDIIKTRTACNTLIYNKIYIKVFETYQDNTIKSNNEFTNYIYNNILEVDSQIDEENKEKLDTLKKDIISNELKLIAKHYILTAYYSCKFSNSRLYIKNNFKKAKNYDPEIKLIKTINYSAFKKNIKSELKKILNQIKTLNREKIKSEKEKAITPIEIKISYIITFISVVSTLSLIGGIIYIQLFFHLLGINATNFFNISDYISSSLDALFVVFMSMIFAIPFYFLKISHILDEKTIDEQFGTNIQSKNDKFESKIKLYIPIILILGLIIHYSLNSEINYNLVILFLYLLISFSLPKFGLWKYIKNSFSISLGTLIFLNFLFIIIIKANAQVEKIKSDNFNKKYNIVLKEEISNEFKFIQSNSNYTFLFNENKVTIIPNSEIKKIEYIP